MITAKTLTETKPMNNTKKERISKDKKPNRICFFDLLRFIIITAFLLSLYHNFVNSASVSLPNHAVRRVYHQCEVLYVIKPQVRCTPARDEIQPRRG